MPLTEFQKTITILLSGNRSPESHLAGGAAIHFQPNSLRYSEDLDYFHDSEAAVASAYEIDRTSLDTQGFHIETEINQPGYIRCVVSKKGQATKIEWAQDSSWRFMPVQFQNDIGYILHPVDLALNKLLALAGRDEPRDFLDVIYTHENTLPLGAQIWAACGKDPGFNPRSLLELIRRRGKYRPEDFARLHLKDELNLQALKQKWLIILEKAEEFIALPPAEDLGCLYYSPNSKSFVQPDFRKSKTPILRHFGRPGGVLPSVVTQS